MITEIICHWMHWDSVWYASPGPFWCWPPRQAWQWFQMAALGIRYRTLDGRVRWGTPGRWHVGTWTGPQHDLLCLKKCATNAEAEKFLSPGGPTILLAALVALIKAWYRSCVDYMPRCT